MASHNHRQPSLDPSVALALEKQVRALGLSDRITLAGECEDLSAAYASADIFALASRYEGYAWCLQKHSLTDCQSLHVIQAPCRRLFPRMPDCWCPWMMSGLWRLRSLLY